ncbi:hypothetical protein ACI2KR_30455 [Pseudomonas luteola]
MRIHVFLDISCAIDGEKADELNYYLTSTVKSLVKNGGLTAGMPAHVERLEISIDRNANPYDKEDAALTVPQLQEKYSSPATKGCHPYYTVKRWATEAAEGNTILAYWHWVSVCIGRDILGKHPNS